MPSEKAVNVDLLRVYKDRACEEFLFTLGWGDSIKVLSVKERLVELELTRFNESAGGDLTPVTASGFVKLPKGRKVEQVFVSPEECRVLKVGFVDVQQGDGAVIETPKGRTVLMDGGDNQLFARYLAGRFRGTSLQKPKEIDCIVVTHGDADHFEGLSEIQESEKHQKAHKRLFILPRRVYHNGLVKRPSSRKELERLGATKKVNGRTIITGLEEDLLAVSTSEMNQPFRRWRKALATWQGRMTGGQKIEFQRLRKGGPDAFAFLADEPGLRFEVLGPVEEQGGLPFLREPPPGPRIGHESLATEAPERGALSASHTINGHSVILKVSCGGFSFLFAGDLNEEAEKTLVREHQAGTVDLRAEVLKVPHHGSADFSGAFLQAVSPMVSVISSGDESEQKEYIHPRANLVGALGRFSRIEEPLVFVTELTAFFKMEGWAARVPEGNAPAGGAPAPKPFFAFSRSAFGIVHARTDGKRLLLFTHSGKGELKEAYAFALKQAQPQPTPVDEIR